MSNVKKREQLFLVILIIFLLLFESRLEDQAKAREEYKEKMRNATLIDDMPEQKQSKRCKSFILFYLAKKYTFPQYHVTSFITIFLKILLQLANATTLATSSPTLTRTKTRAPKLPGKRPKRLRGKSGNGKRPRTRKRRSPRRRAEAKAGAASHPKRARSRWKKTRARRTRGSCPGP